MNGPTFSRRRTGCRKCDPESLSWTYDPPTLFGLPRCKECRREFDDVSGFRIGEATPEGEPSINDRRQWQCPSCGEDAPSRLFGNALHCVLCGDQCEPRPSVLAVFAQKAKKAGLADVVGPFDPPPGIKPGQRYVERIVDGVICLSQPHADEAPPVRGTPAARHGCHNRDDSPPDYLAQDGYLEPHNDGNGTTFRTAKYRAVPHNFKPGCHYDKRETDSKCAGCKHQK